MWMYSLIFCLLTGIFHLNISSGEYSITETQVSVKSKLARKNQTDIAWSASSTARALSSLRPSDFSYTTGTTRPSTLHTTAMVDSNCACSYNQSANLVSCSPFLQTSFSVDQINNTLINVTINDCTFYTNHFSLPVIQGKNIDYLQLYNVNRGDYLVLDDSSFSSFSINQIYVSYSYTQPITILLISTDTFSSSAIQSSVHTLYIDGCYLVTLNKPLASLLSLHSITLISIQQFSWSDLQQQIIGLPKLHYVYVGQDILRATSDAFNVISCSEISSQWIFTFQFIQTCSCNLLTLLNTTRRANNTFQCPNSNHEINLISNVCQSTQRQYLMENQTDVFCKKCLSYSCSNGTACTETPDFGPTCLFVSRHDYETIRRRIPWTSYTKPFLFQESQNYLMNNPNQTLQPNGFNAVATVLIDSNRNQTQGSSSECQMFHQTLSEMLSRPWATAVYSSSVISRDVIQQLLLSLDESVRSINDSESQFLFQSEPLSTMSLRFPTNQILQSTFGWKITSGNEITGNITAANSFSRNITSRVFLQFNKSQIYVPTCNASNAQLNCTNRFSVTSLKAQKLFYYTDRIPSYDVISVIAPRSQQRVTFYFDQPIFSNMTLDNSTNTTSDPFYDQLNVMILEGTCMYLNTTSMIWQTDGCTTDRQASNSTAVTCTCEHLTMFTVFFSLSCATPSKALEILSWIGCVLSIIGLLITLTTFIVIRQCRRMQTTNIGISLSHSSSSQELRRRIMGKPRHLSMVKSMLFMLCVLLILMNILILVLTFVKSGRNLTCTILSASLYYVTLTAFIWKFLFALQQSLFLTNIFQPYWSDRTLFFIYLVITFSLPICPLLVMFIKFDNFTFISSTCNYCWLTREFLLYGLIIPIVMIVCLNIIFYLYTMVHLCSRNRQQLGLRSTKSDQSRQLQNVRIGLFFAVIMGLSWILGFLVLIPNSYVQIFGNILFCLVNTFQGFAFSLMVFCMLERKSFRKCCCCCYDFERRSKPLKPTVNVANINPQLLFPTSNDDHDAKMKTIYNSSIYTSSTTSGGDNQAPDTLEHLSKKKTSAENDDEHFYSSPIF